MKRFALPAAAILLLFLCACTGPAAPTPTPAPTAAPSAAPTAAPATPAPTTAPVPTAEPEPTPAPLPEADSVLTAGGKDYPAYRFSGDLAGSGNKDFTCLLPVEGFTADYVHNAWVIRSAERPEAFLELSFISGGDVERLLPSLMDGYLVFTEIEFSEDAALGRNRGDVGRVSAANAELKAEGWLLNVSGGAAAAVLVCPPDAPEEEALLRAVLDTFALN